MKIVGVISEKMLTEFWFARINQNNINIATDILLDFSKKYGLENGLEGMFTKISNKQIKEIYISLNENIL